MSLSYHNSVLGFTDYCTAWDGRLLPRFSAASLKGVSVLGCTARLQLEGVTQHSSRSGNFLEHSRGYSPLQLSVCPGTNPQNTCHLKPQWLRRTPSPVQAYTFPPRLSEKSLGPSRRNGSDSAHVHPDTKTILILSYIFCPVTYK